MRRKINKGRKGKHGEEGNKRREFGGKKDGEIRYGGE
jgi:hypothetical protein